MLRLEIKLTSVVRINQDAYDLGCEIKTMLKDVNKIIMNCLHKK